jgi:predicted RNA polymerase sigma factor
MPNSSPTASSCRARASPTRRRRKSCADWPQLLALYGVLRGMTDNPMVALNHAVAFAMVHGPFAALDLLTTLAADKRIANHHRLHAVRAHLLEMAGERAAAAESYRLAASRTSSAPEERYLLLRATKATHPTE